MRRPDLLDHEAIGRLALFQGVGREAIEVYLEQCDECFVAQGEALLEPARPNRDIYCIIEGALDVYLGPRDQAPLVSLGAGACVGEMSIIEERYPSAYVIATEDTRLLAIRQQTLWDLVNSSHSVARNLLAILSDRVRMDNRLIASSEGILRQYERTAMTDALTDLNNRHWMDDMFRREIRRCTMNGSDVSLIMLDIDAFKAYNDAHGHLAGDQALAATADALRANVRPNDMVVRFGGDEFAILLPETNLDVARSTAERIRTGIAAAVVGTLDGAALSVSLGVAELMSTGTLEMLLNDADAALYRAKEAGRNCVAV